MAKKADLTGVRYGRLLVVRKATRKFNEEGKMLPPEWECECDCGRTIVIAARNLQSGHTTSCGCFRKETLTNRRSPEKDEIDVEERQWGPCPYPMFGCFRNSQGWCCDDCSKNCEKRCLNLPENCGCSRLEF